MIPRFLAPLALALALSIPTPSRGASADPTGPTLRPRPFALTDTDRAYWAFQPVRAPRIPSPGSHLETTHPIDAFLLAALRERKLGMNPPARPRELVRRAFFDLTGLPPGPGDVEAFEKEPSDAAWTRMVDRLLDSPRYGERWGRHWLDLVRYAESNGYERDGPKPDAWRYRDYLIHSFNTDKPYDRFIREQLSGDEIADQLLASPPTGPDSSTNDWRDAIVATGFYRLHVWDDEPDNTLAAEFDDLDDIMVTTGAAFLGLTVGCARCHDHKFDPFSQADYYSLLGFIRSIDPYGQQHRGGGGRGTGRIQRPLATPAELRQWDLEKKQRIAAAELRLAQIPATEPEARRKQEAELKQMRDAQPPFDHALAIADAGPKAKPTHLLSRGDVSAPREEVAPAFPSVLRPPTSSPPQPVERATSTGRRHVLAAWIASPDNPLTARVMVNRIWQHHFGVGIVPTPDDFGLTGMRPSHPELLDFLAAEFVRSGWSMKSVHRLIMTSRAYRMSSAATRADALAADEGNSLFWRQNLRRLEAEAVRDSMLVVAGTLNPKMGGPGVYPSLPREVHTTQDSAGKGWADSPPGEQNRRSIYLVVKRALKVPLLEALDFANCTSPAGVRPVTTTAPQALMLLNDGFVQTQAAAFADRVAREGGDEPDSRIRHAFLLALQRPPSGGELEAARNLIADQRALARPDEAAPPERTAWQSLCRALLNVNEAIYLD